LEISDRPCRADPQSAGGLHGRAGGIVNLQPDLTGRRLSPEYGGNTEEYEGEKANAACKAGFERTHIMYIPLTGSLFMLFSLPRSLFSINVGPTKKG
jgi:hypothetical protein